MAQLVLQFRGPRVETEDEVVEIEDALLELLEDGETCDGHGMRISLDTPDAQGTFARIAPFLTRAGLIDHVAASSRAHAGEDFVTLWPRPAATSDRE